MLLRAVQSTPVAAQVKKELYRQGSCAEHVLGVTNTIQIYIYKISEVNQSPG